MQLNGILNYVFWRLYCWLMFIIMLQWSWKKSSKPVLIYSYMIHLRTVGQDAKPVEWIQSPKGLMAGLLRGSVWHRSCSGAPSEGQRSRQIAVGSWPSWALEDITALLQGTYSLFFCLSQGLRMDGMTLLPWTELPRRKRYSRESCLDTIKCWPLEKQ